MVGYKNQAKHSELFPMETGSYYRDSSNVQQKSGL